MTFHLSPASGNLGQNNAKINFNFSLHILDGIRLSSQTSIEALMEQDFDLVVNEVHYRVVTPEKERMSQVLFPIPRLLRSYCSCQCR
jgi:hypothetical protein